MHFLAFPDSQPDMRRQALEAGRCPTQCATQLKAGLTPCHVCGVCTLLAGQRLGCCWAALEQLLSRGWALPGQRPGFCWRFLTASLTYGGELERQADGPLCATQLKAGLKPCDLQGMCTGALPQGVCRDLLP